MTPPRQESRRRDTPLSFVARSKPALAMKARAATLPRKRHGLKLVDDLAVAGSPVPRSSNVVGMQ
jgi:hypothetical protein